MAQTIREHNLFFTLGASRGCFFAGQGSGLMPPLTYFFARTFPILFQSAKLCFQSERPIP
tara:strand:+ start:4114 stop:4293 length:180 start_codon:yes stop_codon:yes gene_type:complete